MCSIICLDSRLNPHRGKNQGLTFPLSRNTACETAASFIWTLCICVFPNSTVKRERILPASERVQMKSFGFFGEIFPFSLQRFHVWCDRVRCLCQPESMCCAYMFRVLSIVTHSHLKIYTCNMQTTQIRASWFMSTIIRWGALSFRWIVCVCGPVDINLPKTHSGTNTIDEDVFPLCNRRKKPKRVLLHFRQANTILMPFQLMACPFECVCVLSMSCDKSSAVQTAKKKQSNK